MRLIKTIALVAGMYLISLMAEVIMNGYCLAGI